MRRLSRVSSNGCARREFIREMRRTDGDECRRPRNFPRRIARTLDLDNFAFIQKCILQVFSRSRVERHIIDAAGNYAGRANGR